MAEPPSYETIAEVLAREARLLHAILNLVVRNEMFVERCDNGQWYAWAKGVPYVCGEGIRRDDPVAAILAAYDQRSATGPAGGRSETARQVCLLLEEVERRKADYSLGKPVLLLTE